MDSRWYGRMTHIGLMLSALIIASLACNFLTEEPTPAPLPTQAIQEISPTSTPISILEPTAIPIGQTTAELATAAVQILALIPEGGGWSAIWSGSGSIISPDGLILTNAHVVDDRAGEYSSLGIAITHRSDEAPQLSYFGEISAVDYALDLAIVRIVTDLQGNPVSLSLPYIRLGDSDSIEIGDKLRILGYPGIGGETITFTEGAVSGFTSERSVGGRAWIKTDATIAGGNSGGMGANERGELIGIPTIVTSGSESGDNVDCRPLADTNRDGLINEMDTCVPVGGFINALRPVNLAQPLLEAALQGQQYSGPTQPLEMPEGGYDLSNTRFYNLLFADGVTENDQPTQIMKLLPNGVRSLCAFWDFEGMVDGMPWSGNWFVNGELSEGGSYQAETWTGGGSGNWWVCITNDMGLDDGLYEMVLAVQDEVMATDSVFIGGNRRLVDFNLVNESSATIYYVRLSPSDAQNWGPDELSSEEVIYSGETRTFSLVSAYYDLLLQDLEGEILLEEYGIDVTDTVWYTISD